ALAELPLLVGARPGGAAVVGAEHAAVLRLHDGPHPVAPPAAHRHADLADHAGRQPRVAGDLGPGLAAVGGAEEPAPRPAAGERPGGAAHLPERGVESVGAVRGEDEVDGARAVDAEEG